MKLRSHKVESRSSTHPLVLYPFPGVSSALLSPLYSLSSSHLHSTVSDKYHFLENEPNSLQTPVDRPNRDMPSPENNQKDCPGAPKQIYTELSRSATLETGRLTASNDHPSICNAELETQPPLSSRPIHSYDALQNLLFRADPFPLEILVKIFNECFPSVDGPSLHPVHNNHQNIRLVCHRWKAIFDAFIGMSINPGKRYFLHSESTNHRQFYRQIIQNADRFNELTIDVIDGYLADYELVRTIATGISKSKSVIIRLPSYPLIGNASTLHNWNIQDWNAAMAPPLLLCADHVEHEDELYTTPHLDETPSLVHFSWQSPSPLSVPLPNRFGLPWKQLIHYYPLKTQYELPWSQLESLNLDCLLSLKDCRSILSKCRSLQRATFKTIFSETGTASTLDPFSLPSLQSLTIESFVDLTPIFEVGTFEALQTLNICLFGVTPLPHESLLPLRELTKLTLDCDISYDTAYRLIDLCKELQELTWREKIVCNPLTPNSDNIDHDALVTIRIPSRQQS